MKLILSLSKEKSKPNEKNSNNTKIPPETYSSLKLDEFNRTLMKTMERKKTFGHLDHRQPLDNVVARQRGDNLNVNNNNNKVISSSGIKKNKLRSRAAVMNYENRHMGFRMRFNLKKTFCSTSKKK
jgi:hypothetical protein